MWGAIGFGFAAVVFTLFAYTAQKITIHETTKFHKNYYALGMYVAASACAVWAAAILLNNSTILSISIIVGDFLLIIASLYILSSWVSDKIRTPLLFGLGFIGLLFISTRIFIYKPTAYIYENILIFNTPRILATLLIVLFFSVWFIANYRFYKIIAKLLEAIPGISSLVYVFNIAAFIGICGFLVARKPLTIVISFAVFSVAYLFLGYVNIVAKKVEIRHG